MPPPFLLIFSFCSAFILSPQKIIGNKKSLPAGKLFVFAFLSALKASGLAVHILNNDIENFAFSGAVFENFPGSVGVVMKFDKFFITNDDKAIAGNFGHEVIMDLVFIKVCAFERSCVSYLYSVSSILMVLLIFLRQLLQQLSVLRIRHVRGRSVP